MEGIGVAVLVFLFVTVQSMPSDKQTVTDTDNPAPESVIAETTSAEEIPFTGHYANSWSEYQLKRQQQELQQQRLSSTARNSY